MLAATGRLRSTRTALTLRPNPSRAGISGIRWMANTGSSKAASRLRATPTPKPAFSKGRPTGAGGGWSVPRARVFGRRIFLSIMLTMGLIGIWHGAGWNWLIFGIMHGLFVGIHRVILNKIPLLQNNSFFKSKFGKVISILGTQYLVFLSLIAFRVVDLNEMLYSMEKFVFWDFQTSETIQIILSHKVSIILILLFGILHFISYKKVNLPEIISKFKLRYWVLFLTIIIFLIVFFYDGNPEAFIYFQF